MADGLWSVHVTLGDGRLGKGSGVLVLREGRLLGGDAFLFYRGSYEVDGATLRGEVVVAQHTPSGDSRPIFGGREVGIGFSGAIAEGAATLRGTALVGRDSVAFRATLRRLAPLSEP